MVLQISGEVVGSFRLWFLVLKVPGIMRVRIDIVANENDFEASIETDDRWRIIAAVATIEVPKLMTEVAKTCSERTKNSEHIVISACFCLCSMSVCCAMNPRRSDRRAFKLQQ